MNRYHVTITNNETKEVEFDTDLKAVLLAGSQGKAGVVKVNVQHCTPLELTFALCVLLEIVDEELEEDPKIKLLVDALRVIKETDKNQE